MKKRTLNQRGFVKRKKLIFLWCVVLICSLLFSCERKSNNAISRAPDTIIQIQEGSQQQGNQIISNYEIYFTPVIEFHGEAFPVKSLATASMNTRFDGSPRMMTNDDYIGDAFGDLGVSISVKGNSSENIFVRVEIEGDRFIKKSNHETNIPTNKEIEIFPRIVYNYTELENLIQPANENVYFRLYIANNLVKEKVEIVRFHSVNEVPLAEISRWDNDTIIDHSWLFAAYVNEDDPFIDKILQEALKIGTVEKIGLGGSFSFGGYQDIDGDDDPSLEVYLQVLAVWSVFQRHNIKYSNIATTSTGNQSIATQYVRTLQESFGNSQANCVDGSVLFASVLRKLGIEPFLVLMPGHMFLGYDLDKDGNAFGFLETTMLGNTDVSKYSKDESLMGKLKLWTGVGKTQSTVSRDSFLVASSVAENEWEEIKDKFETDDDYQIIQISNYRSAGIMPIKRY
jgi:hypothetical protein